MDDFKFYGFLFIGIYLSIMIVTGLLYSRKEAGQDFIIGNRNIGIIPTAASLAASFRDGGGIAFWVTAGFAASYGGLWLFVGVGISCLILTLIGPRLRAEAEADKLITIQERVRHFIGPVSAKLAAIVSLIFGLLIISIQYHVTGNIFAEILQVPAYIGVAIVCAILILYLLAGGYKSVIVTDTIQFFVMFSLVIVPFLIPAPAESFNNVKSFWEPSAADKIAFFLFGIYYLLIAPECWQRIFSARDDKTVRIGLPLTLAMLVIMTLSLIWLGMGVKAVMPDISKDNVYAEMFRNVPDIAPWVQGYLLVVFLSITMSTQSAACYSFSSTLSTIFFAKKTENDKSYIHFSRIAMASCLVGAAVLSLTIHGVVQYMFDAVGFIMCLAPLYIFSAVANRFDSYKTLNLEDRKHLDGIITVITIGGIAAFLWQLLSGMSDAGFIYSMMPSVISTVAISGAIILFLQGSGKTATA